MDMIFFTYQRSIVFYFLFCLVLSCHVNVCLVLPCLVLSTLYMVRVVDNFVPLFLSLAFLPLSLFCLCTFVLSCLVLFVLSCLVLPCLALSCLVLSKRDLVEICRLDLVEICRLGLATVCHLFLRVKPPKQTSRARRKPWRTWQRRWIRFRVRVKTREDNTTQDKTTQYDSRREETKQNNITQHNAHSTCVSWPNTSPRRVVSLFLVSCRVFRLAVVCQCQPFRSIPPSVRREEANGFTWSWFQMWEWRGRNTRDGLSSLVLKSRRFVLSSLSLASSSLLRSPDLLSS